MRKERVGFAVCGSFCTHQQVLKALEALVEEYETVIPIVSENAAFTDTRFGTSDALMERLDPGQLWVLCAQDWEVPARAGFRSLSLDSLRKGGSRP